MNNAYIPFPSEIKEVIRHTKKEYTFRMHFEGEVKPGQFFEVSVPKYGEAPISVSGLGKDYVDLTIREKCLRSMRDNLSYCEDLTETDSM